MGSQEVLWELFESDNDDPISDSNDSHIQALCLKPKVEHISENLSNSKPNNTSSANTTITNHELGTPETSPSNDLLAMLPKSSLNEVKSSDMSINKNSEERVFHDTFEYSNKEPRKKNFLTQKEENEPTLLMKEPKRLPMVPSINSQLPFIPNPLETNYNSNSLEFPESLHLSYTIEKQKYGEDDSTPNWYNHKLHVFIFTYSGKPVYTRYGSEERLAAFTGTLAAVLTTMQSLFLQSDDHDELRYIKAGKFVFAFIYRGPLWLAAISSKGDFFCQIEALLNNVHLQIISLLTRTIEKALTIRPSYDMRQLLGGTEGVIYNYISWHQKDMFPLVKGFEPLPLNSVARGICLNTLKDVQSPNIVAGIMFAQHRIIGLSISKTTKLPPSDIILLLNLVLSSASLRQAESWMPICLPGINDSAFLYAYVNFITTDTVGLIFISTNSDSEQFYAISQHFTKINNIVSSNSCINEIHSSIRSCPLKLDPQLDHLEIIHMLCFSTSLQQYFSSNFNLNYDNKEMKRRIFKLYSQCNYLVRNLKIPSHIYLKGENEAAYIWKINEFHLYLCIPRWKTITSQTLSLLTGWIKSNLNTLFITSIPPLNI